MSSSVSSVFCTRGGGKGGGYTLFLGIIHHAVTGSPGVASLFICLPLLLPARALFAVEVYRRFDLSSAIVARPLA